jgi:hypothetical protein
MTPSSTKWPLRLSRAGSDGALNPREDESVAAPRKHPDELPEWAIRQAVDARRDPATRTGGVEADRRAAGDQP